MGQNQINDDYHNKNALSIWKMPRHLVYNIKTSSVLNWNTFACLLLYVVWKKHTLWQLQKEKKNTIETFYLKSRDILRIYFIKTCTSSVTIMENKLGITQKPGSQREIWKGNIPWLVFCKIFRRPLKRLWFWKVRGYPYRL
jgi:hypothetical protein